MDLQFTPEEEAFRGEVLQFLKDKLPAHLSNKVKSGLRLTREDMAQWHAILNERGWLANHWPRQYGGPGWGAVQKFIFENECALAGAPRIVPFGVNMLGPVLIKYGSEAQKQYWLPRILNGQDWWCQGYSEPGSGSDLASVKTTARSDGDDYVITGGKMWITNGAQADWICLLANTGEGPVHRNKSLICVPMTTKGVSVARTLLRDRLEWTVRQKDKLANLGARLAAITGKLGLVRGASHSLTQNTTKEAKPMVSGVTTFAKSFEQAVEDLGGGEVKSWRLNAWGTDGPEVAREILTQDPRPTAVFAVTDHEALFLYEAAAELGLEIPQDVSIVGFADLDFAATLRPPLTSMRQKPREIGRRAAQQILDRLDGGAGDTPPTTIKVGADLIVRKSTARPR